MSKKEHRSDFQELDQGLSKEIVQLSSKSEINIGKRLAVVLIVVSMMGIVWFIIRDQVAALLPEATNKTAQVASTPKTEEEKRRERFLELEAAYVTQNADEFKYDWTVENFDALASEYDGGEGALLTDIVAQRGKGTSIEFVRKPTVTGESVPTDQIVLHYEPYIFGNSEELTNVRLQFRKDGEDYVLISKSYMGLPSQTYTAATPEEFQFIWDQATVDTLKVSKNVTDTEAEEALDIIERFGKPTSVNLYAFDESEQLLLYYQLDNDPTKTRNSVALNFSKINGKYYLNSKNAVFRSE